MGFRNFNCNEQFLKTQKLLKTQKKVFCLKMNISNNTSLHFSRVPLPPTQPKILPPQIFSEIILLFGRKIFGFTEAAKHQNTDHCTF